MGRPTKGIQKGAGPLRPHAAPARSVATGSMNRGASPDRGQARAVRIDAARQTMAKAFERPRPQVRPAAPPQKIMPKQPAPVISRHGIARPAAVPPSGPLKSMQKGAAPAPVPSAPHRPGAAIAAGAAALGVLALATSAAHPDISPQVNSLQNSLSDLQERSSFNDIQESINRVDADLNHAISLLESAREKGYLYQNDLEKIAYETMDRWQAVRDQVAAAALQRSTAMQTRLMPLSGQVNRLNAVLGNPGAATPLISNTQSQVNALINEVGTIESNLRGMYSSVEENTSTLNSRLSNIHWALTQLAEAKFKPENGENLVMAVPARWDQPGDDDPEGVLYLTDRSLIFERKEKVATKKVLFITVAKELVQEVLIKQPAASVQEVKAANRGLFGHHDYVETAFSDPKLGSVPFHLNGQPSAQWVEWIQAVKSGAIQNDRTSGSGISYEDLTGPLTTADLMALQTEVNSLQDEMLLKGTQEALAEVENDVRSLERKLSNLRARGYVIEKNLEADMTVLASQWDRIKANAEKTMQSQTQILGEGMQGIQRSLAQVMGMSNNLAAARPLFIQLKSSIASAEAQADAAESSVLAMFDEYGDEVGTLSAHLDWVEWMLDALSTASFKLLATESGVAAVEATYARPGLEAENGILFLTDQRLVWEDRVDAFEVKVEVPLQNIEDVQKQGSEETGERLVFRFTGGTAYPGADFALGMPLADAWLKMIGRARSGGYAEDRAVQLDPAELERIKNAPQQCANCGAAFTAPILRGQSEIACEYCGLVTRI
jgi:predicted  nucleic acid-binding Zn-ribbon protein